MTIFWTNGPKNPHFIPKNFWIKISRKNVLTLHCGLKDTLRKSRMSSIYFVNLNSQNFVFVRRDCKSIFLSISEICVSLCMLGISIFQIDIFTMLEIWKVCAKMFFQNNIFDFMHRHNMYYFKRSTIPISFDRTTLGTYF